MSSIQEVVLSLRVPNNWVADLVSKHPATVRILSCKPLERGEGIQQLVELSSETGLEELLRSIRSSPNVLDAYVVKTKKGRMLGTVLTKNSMICRAAMGSDTFCRTCFFNQTSHDDGTVEWTLALSGKNSLKQLLERLADENIRVEIRRLSRIIDKRQLTPRQERVVRMAMDMGYFDFPRRTGLQKLAKTLKVSPASLSETLRSAERKILRDYIFARPD